MKKTAVFAAAFLLAFTPAVFALEMEGVRIPETLQAGTGTLVLNGAGVRTKFFMDLYVCALYLETKRSEPDRILESDRPAALRLHIVSSLITSEKMEKATRKGFENSAGGDTEAIADRIETFLEAFEDKIVENDVFDIVYTPSDGSNVFKNGKLKTSIPGSDFKRALFGIWLGDKPAQKSLKEDLLGRE